MCYVSPWSTGRFMPVLWVFMATVFSLYKGFFFQYKSLYFESYETMPMLAEAHISRLGYLWSDQHSAVETSPSITKLLSGSLSKIMCQRVNVKLEANARVYISLGSIVQWNLHSRPPLHSTATLLADSPYTITID